MVTLFDTTIEDVNAIETPVHTGKKAFNSGTIKMKVVINRTCPFMKSQFVNDTLIFNQASLSQYPASIHNVVRTTQGLDGVYLHPDINYRHNFIMGYRNVAGPLQTPQYEGDFLRSNSTFIQQTPVYLDDHTFIISDTIFGSGVLNPFQYHSDASQNIGGCDVRAKWSYDYIPRSPVDPGIVSEDRTSEKANLDVAVQVPIQESTQTCDGPGVHWRVVKKTPLFRGEDFFIEFFNRSKTKDIIKNKDNEDHAFKIPYYEPLNVRSETFSQFQGITMPINSGLVKYDQGTIEDGTQLLFTPLDRRSYDLTNQAYFIVEIGHGHPEHNYFIFLVENAPPRCVQIRNGISFQVGQDYTGSTIKINSNKEKGEPINSKVLFELDNFTMSVRHHLDRMVITFEGADFVSTPWIIEKTELRIDEGTCSVVRPEGTSPMTVPDNARLIIWGGNQVAGFLFGVIQYRHGFLINGGASFILPHMGQFSYIKQSCLVQETIHQNMAGKFMSLPKDGKHFLLFSSTDNPAVNLGPDGKFTKGPFSQDAGVFVEERDGIPFPDIGFFLYGETLKDQDIKWPSQIQVRKVGPIIFDPSNRSQNFRIEFSLIAGSHSFSSGWFLPRCKTPIMTMCRLESVPDQTPRWDTTTTAIDVTEHVMEFTESWSAQDIKKIEHSGTIRFLLNPSAKYETNHTNELIAMRGKTFYIEVWAGYDTDEILIDSPSTKKSICNYSGIPGMYKLFTGLCHGGTITYEVGTRIMDCQIFDYNKILDDQLFFNAPFFDGVRDFNAIYDILNFAGFRSDEPTSPGFILKNMAQNSDNQVVIGTGADGRQFISRLFINPFAYAQLDQPKLKPNDGDKFSSAIDAMSEKAGKFFYFDSFGVAHYENTSFLDIIIDTFKGIIVNPIFKFTTNPNLFEGHQVFKTVTIQEDVGSVYNHLKAISNTPDWTPLFADDFNWNTIDNPNIEGFIGYLKTFFLQEGAYGSEEALFNQMITYRSFFRPPYIMRFQTYGLPVRAADIVSLNGQTLRVAKVESTISPAENLWWQQIECEWLRPATADL